jgi:hypothetical protein
MTESNDGVYHLCIFFSIGLVNRIESTAITGEALPSPLQLGTAILCFKILSN